MKCRHCNTSGVTALFNLQLCCEGRKKRRIWLCQKCDAEIQRRMVRFFNLKEVSSAIVDG